MPDSASKRVSRDQWLAGALEMFARTGADGLRVEQLARSLGVAKSGFYFHFKDREDLLQQLVDYWEAEYTASVLTNPMLLMVSPEERLRMIATYVFEQNLAEYESAMQVWSKQDADVAKKVRKVINARLTFVSKAFEELGFEGDELAARARLFLGYITSERPIFGADKADSERCRRWMLDALITH